MSSLSSLFLRRGFAAVATGTMQQRRYCLLVGAAQLVKPDQIVGGGEGGVAFIGVHKRIEVCGLQLQQAWWVKAAACVSHTGSVFSEASTAAIHMSQSNRSLADDALANSAFALIARRHFHHIVLAVLCPLGIRLLSLFLRRFPAEPYFARLRDAIRWLGLLGRRRAGCRASLHICVLQTRFSFLFFSFQKFKIKRAIFFCLCARVEREREREREMDTPIDAKYMNMTLNEYLTVECNKNCDRITHHATYLVDCLRFFSILLLLSSSSSSHARSKITERKPT